MSRLPTAVGELNFACYSLWMDSSDKLKKISEWLGSGSINIFGLPFAGKDTQGGRLADKLDASLLGGGEILRSSEVPGQIKNLHRTGKLFPTDIYLNIVVPYLSKDRYKDRPLILSSLGRWHGEESGILEAAAAAGHPIKAVIYLNIDETTALKRWEKSNAKKERRHRADDSYEVLQVRLKEFREKTLPVIEFYRAQNLLIEMDSEQEKNTVSKKILDSLLEFANSDSRA